MRLWSLYRVFVANAITRARVVGFLCVGAVLLAIALGLRSVNPVDAVLNAGLYLDLASLRMAIPVAALVFGTATIGDSLDDGTYVYLWLRPSPRWQITFAAFAATVTGVVPLVGIPSVVGAWLIDPSPEVLIGAVGSVSLSILAYSALFVMFGHLTQRGLIWGIGYLLIVEQFISAGGAGLGFITVHSHAVSFVARVLKVDLSTDYFGLAMATVSPLAFTGLFLGISVIRQRRMTVP